MSENIYIGKLLGLVGNRLTWTPWEQNLNVQHICTRNLVYRPAVYFVLKMLITSFNSFTHKAKYVSKNVNGLLLCNVRLLEY